MKIFFLLSVFISAQYSWSQTLEEWTAQNETQIKYLVEQISALKVYGNYLHKGYQVIQKGLNTVGAIKEGDLSMHQEYFGSMKAVNPTIKNLSAVETIIQLQRKVVADVYNYFNQLSRINILKKHELLYSQNVYRSIINRCISIVDDLLLVTSDNQLDMRDDERLAWIQKLYNEMQAVNTTTQSFGNSLRLLAIQRSREQNNNSRIQQLYELRK